MLGKDKQQVDIQTKNTEKLEECDLIFYQTGEDLFHCGISSKLWNEMRAKQKLRLDSEVLPDIIDTDDDDEDIIQMPLVAVKAVIA